MKTLVAIIWLILSPTVSSTSATASDILNDISDRVRESFQSGEAPIAIFDLDDTLFRSGTRTLTILNEFTWQPEIASRFAHECERVRNLSLTDLKYDIEDTLLAIGIESTEFLCQAKTYWTERFFSNAYVTLDPPTPGAVEYVQSLHEVGAIIVYLTGRDTPRMRSGTEWSLYLNQFPTDERAILLTKPTHEMDDTQFKENAFAEIARWGTVVACFENEPRNINAMNTAFPAAAAVFLDTIHSKKPDVPGHGIHWIKDFR